YHFMFAPNQTEGCKMCSFWADNFNSIIPHLKQRDVNFVCVSRGEVEKLEAFKKKWAGILNGFLQKILVLILILMFHLMPVKKVNTTMLNTRAKR
ncbi:MAG: hypothetical protein COW08_03950, partial [Ignavibacteriales bacterium CG12_big_fil_rev_8_21_14_0_65_30_8]